jgi:hypothetical protein
MKSKKSSGKAKSSGKRAMKDLPARKAKSVKGGRSVRSDSGQTLQIELNAPGPGLRVYQDLS